MKTHCVIKHYAIVVLLFCMFSLATAAKLPQKGTAFPEIKREPYVGAIAIDADTGQVIFDDNADATVYPASVVKLMNLLIILEKLDGGTLKFSDTVQVTKEAAGMGGSDVWLDPRESFTLDDMLYMLMVQSANDAAVALTIHVAGSTSAFMELMNKKAADLGLKSTTYHSVHGLPPSVRKGQLPDTTTPRDMALLGRELLKHADTLRYTSTRQKSIRREIGKVKETVMNNHNNLLSSFPGCDGFKTGYFYKGGFSIVTTAKRDGRRIIVAVMGSPTRKGRDKAAMEIMSKAFLNLPPLPPPPPPASTNLAATELSPPVQDTTGQGFFSRRSVLFGLAALAVFIVVWTLASFFTRRSRLDFDN